MVDEHSDGFRDHDLAPVPPAAQIGIVGAAAAIANAVYYATGQRVRYLPITPAKLVS